MKQNNSIPVNMYSWANDPWFDYSINDLSDNENDNDNHSAGRGWSYNIPL